MTAAAATVTAGSFVRIPAPLLEEAFGRSSSWRWCLVMVVAVLRRRYSRRLYWQKQGCTTTQRSASE